MTSEAFDPEDLFNYRTTSALDAVPGRECVVCAVQTADREADDYRSALWLVPLDGDPPRQLTNGLASDQSPRWSPDGRRIAFLSDRGGGAPQIHLIEADGGEAWALSRFTAGVTSLRWSPDGDRLLCVCPTPVDPERRGERSGQPPPEAAPAAPELCWRLPYKLDGSGYTLNQELHLFTIDIDGQSHQLTDGAFEVRDACWSPDGRFVAYARTRDARLGHRSDIWRAAADGSDARQLTQDHPSAASPAWSPDGRWIAFMSSEEDGDSQFRLWLIDLASGAVSAFGSRDVEVVTGESLHWLEDSSAIAVIVADKGLQVLKTFAVPSGEETVVRGGERQLSLLGMTRGHWVYGSETAVQPLELKACRRDGLSEERRITHFNAWWDQRQAPVLERRRFEVPDGDGGTETIEGWVLRPAGVQGRTPWLIDIHGGPASYVLMSYSAHAYWLPLCAKGWSVLALDAVGSSSYGKEFSSRLCGRWGELDLPQHLAAVEQLRQQGQADARTAIAGKSYGGYLAAWAIGQCSEFRAAVVSAPVTNLESHYGTSDSGYHADRYSIGDVPHCAREQHIALSPMSHAHTACTPTLILQGKEDERCPKSQAEELFVTLMAQGEAPAEMVLYPGSGHHFFERGRPSHRLDAIKRLIDWVEKWIDTPMASHSPIGSARGDGGPRQGDQQEHALLHHGN
jgi:dipeptidyl aminopeptidase/acylaminoacyl peptidase